MIISNLHLSPGKHFSFQVVEGYYYSFKLLLSSSTYDWELNLPFWLKKQDGPGKKKEKQRFPIWPFGSISDRFRHKHSTPVESISTACSKGGSNGDRITYRNIIVHVIFDMVEIHFGPLILVTTLPTSLQSRMNRCNSILSFCIWI